MVTSAGQIVVCCCHDGQILEKPCKLQLMPVKSLMMRAGQFPHAKSGGGGLLQHVI